ncbi:MAG: hypothetical protein V8Q79_00295 [Christensenellales bacterium]
MGRMAPEGHGKGTGMTPKWHPNVILRFKKRYDMISSAKEEKRFAAEKSERGFKPDRRQVVLLSAFFLHFAGKLRSIHQSKKPFPVLERLFLMRWGR